MVKVIGISLPEELIQVMDDAAKAVYASRSEYIRQAVVDRLRRDWKLDGEAAARARQRQFKQALQRLQFDL